MTISFEEILKKDQACAQDTCPAALGSQSSVSGASLQRARKAFYAKHRHWRRDNVDVGVIKPAIAYMGAAYCNSNIIASRVANYLSPQGPALTEVEAFGDMSTAVYG
ncbi:hypothetical protein HK405_000052, partial [Cladochytrium tenue]